MRKVTLERIKKKKRDYRLVFKTIWDYPLISPKDAAKLLKWQPTRYGTRLSEALDLGIIIGPHIKLRSFQNLKVHIYFANSEDPMEAFLKYKEDNNIIYHARMDGFADLMVISKEKININTVFEGIPTDYYVSFPPNICWDKSIDSIWGKIDKFHIEGYVPLHIIKSHWDEKIEWTETDEILYGKFKYNIRKSKTSIIRESGIQRKVINEWLEKVFKYCDILTYYYPESASFYEPILYMIETDYEDFLIDIFSELPTSSLFFKVKDRLFMHLHIDKRFIRNSVSTINDISGLHLPLIIRDLKKKGIIKSSNRAIFASYWRKNI